MTKTESAIRWMENLANDNSHGYAWGGWGPSDYDCGHAIITAWETAGVPVKTAGAASTHNMYHVFMSCGFMDVTEKINLSNGSGLRRGDVLIHDNDHAVMACGNGKIVHARSGEGNTISGDQSGNEIRIQPYFQWQNGGWQHVLRYSETERDETEENENKENAVPVIEVSDEKRAYLVVQQGDGMIGTPEEIENGRRRTKPVQCLLNLHFGNEIEALEEDGEFGPLTKKAVERFQKENGLEDNGVVDGNVWPLLKLFEV